LGVAVNGSGYLLYQVLCEREGEKSGREREREEKKDSLSREKEEK
jgi:hypothetical protein